MTEVFQTNAISDAEKDAAMQDSEEETRENILANRELIKEMSDTNSKLKQEIEQDKKELTRHRTIM